MDYSIKKAINSALVSGAIATSSGAQAGDLDLSLEKRIGTANPTANVGNMIQYRTNNSTNFTGDEPQRYFGVSFEMRFGGDGSDLGKNYSLSANFGATNEHQSLSYSVPIVQARNGIETFPMNNLTTKQKIGVGVGALFAAAGIYSIANSDSSSSNDESSSTDNNSNTNDQDSTNSDSTSGSSEETTGDNTGGSTGGSDSGSTGGDTGSSIGGSDGGSTGGDSGGSTGGSDGGSGIGDFF